MTEEVWKDIAGYEGLYQISNLGRVKSLERVKIRSNGSSLYVKEKILKPSIRKTGYKSYGLQNNGIKTVYAHRLIYQEFVGAIPEGMEVCHNDGDATNNNLDNLRIDTHKNNVGDMLSHGTRPVGERNGNAKVTEDIVIKLRSEYEKLGKTRGSISKVARDFDLTVHMVGKVVRRDRWRHVA